MAARNIAFTEFSPDIQRLLNQSLNAVLAQTAEMPTIFCLYGGNESPTQAEINLTTEILRTTLTDQTIYYGVENYIADAIRYIIWDIETWIGGRDAAQTEEESMKEYAVRYGIDINAACLVELKCLARNLSPHTEITVTSRISTDPRDPNLAKCLEALQTSTSVANIIDYGQYNVGIVADNVLFDFPRDHTLIDQIKELIEAYQAIENKGETQ